MGLEISFVEQVGSDLLVLLSWSWSGLTQLGASGLAEMAESMTLESLVEPRAESTVAVQHQA